MPFFTGMPRKRRLGRWSRVVSLSCWLGVTAVGLSSAAEPEALSPELRASYLDVIRGGYQPHARVSAADALLLAASGRAHTMPAVPASPSNSTRVNASYFLESHIDSGGFRYDVDAQLAELLSLVDGRCGFEVSDSHTLSIAQLEQHIFLQRAALFKRSRDAGVGA
jgi:hypothetical protein